MDPLAFFPAEFRGGTTLKVRREYGNFPANDGWTAVLTLYGPNTLTKAGIASGAAFDFQLNATETDTEAAAGVYRYVVQVTKAAEVYEAESGRLTVLRSMTGLAGSAGQSLNEQWLALVNTMMAGKLTKDMQSYQVAGRALNRYSFDELLKLKAALEMAVAQERDAGAFGGPVKVVFDAAGRL